MTRKPKPATKKKHDPAPPLPDGVEEVLRVPAMMRACGLKRTQLMDLVKEGIIPKPVPIGKQVKGWFRSDVIAYQQRLRNQRDDTYGGSQ